MVLSQLERPQDGFYAQTFEDSAGDIIIAFEGTSFDLPGSIPADKDIAAGIWPAALGDAVQFVRQVEKDYGSNNVYLDGYSLGGAEAEEVASVLGNISGGVTFVAPGLPGYYDLNPPISSNFINYIDAADPIGNYADDQKTELQNIAAILGNGSHYGEVVSEPDSESINDGLGELAVTLGGTYLSSKLGGIPEAQTLLKNIIDDAFPLHSIQHYASDLGYQIGVPLEITPQQDESLYAEFSETLANGIGGPLSGAAPVSDLAISGRASATTQIDTPLALSSLFSPPVTSGSGDTVDHYNVVNTLEGPGALVIDGLVYTQPFILGVTPSELQTAYFFSPQPGVDEIDIVAVDRAGNTSNPASSTITVGAAISPPPPASSDLTISAASLLNSSLIAGGGGTLGFTVQNSGSLAAPSTAFSQIYLSTNSTLDSSDILISPGAISDAGLAAGASQSEHLSFTLPSNIAGSYYLIAFAGDSDQIANGAPAGSSFAMPVMVSGTGTSPSSPAPTSPQPSGPNPISIKTNATITTRVGSEPTIESSALLAVDSQYPNDADLRYTIVTPPAHGRLIDGGVTTSTFTQADLDTPDQVDYVQDGTSVSTDSFTFYVSDPSGYRSPVETFTFNILPANPPPPPPPPTPPLVSIELADDTGYPTQPGALAYTTSNDALSGTSDPGATVNLFLDGSTPLGSAIANSSGNWTYSPTGLAQGGHSITAAETNAAGLTGTSTLAFVYDTVAPAAPSAPTLALGGDVADTSTPTFSGAAEADDEVLLLEGNTVIGTGMATPQGTWTIETAALSPGWHNISAESIDPAGNMSPVSAATTIEVVPPPPDQVTLTDATMIGAGDLTTVGTVTDPDGGTLTEYGPIAADGFTLTDISRANFSFATWSSGWTVIHDVNGVAEYYDGPDVLIVPTNGIIVPGSSTGDNPVASGAADTIDLKRADGAAFSLVSINVGPTGDYPTSAVFTGTTAAGQTITETVEINLPQNSTLQPIALTGFNDVTDVKFTENRGSVGGDPTSIEFDNVVLGAATPPSSPPSPAPLTAPVTLDDQAMASAGELPLISTDDSAFYKGAYSDYGPIAADGFTITNLDRSDFAFSSYDSNWASIGASLGEGYFYDGPDVLNVPTRQNDVTPSRIEIQREDDEDFGIESIKLDTLSADSEPTHSVTFTGTTAGGDTVTQTFMLDNAPGFQTFQFDSDFDNLKSLQFVGDTYPLYSTFFQFDDIELTPPVPATPTGLELSSASDKGDDIANVSTPIITGAGAPGDTVTLYDGGEPVGSGTVGSNGSWAITANALADGSHSMTAIDADANGDLSGVSAPLPITIDTTAWTGNSGNDIVSVSSSYDSYNGGGGINTAVFSGTRSSYVITPEPTSGMFVVSGPNGTDLFENIQVLQFSDSTSVLAADTPAGIVNNWDSLEYIASYGDLIAAFGANVSAGLSHFLTYGYNEGRTITFDGLEYVAGYGDLIRAFAGAGSMQAVQDDGATHFIDYGDKEGRSTTFDGLRYIASYGDLINAFGAGGSMQAVQDDGAYHYIEYGFNEGRSTTFDGLDYIASYGDLIKAFGAAGSMQAVQDDGAYHYIEYGFNEGRSTTFDGLRYIASYADLINAFGAVGSMQAVQDDGAYHYIEYGHNEGRSTTFDGLGYIASYGDLINAFGAAGSMQAVQDDGAYHYIEYGFNEGRSTTFDGLRYIASYADLINAFGAAGSMQAVQDDGAYHYIEYGHNEGRSTTFDGLSYIANYTDLMKAFGANNDAGAIHYIDYGFNEHRVTTFSVAAYESQHPDLIGKYATNDQFLTAYINTYVTTGHLLT